MIKINNLKDFEILISIDEKSFDFRFDNASFVEVYFGLINKKDSSLIALDSFTYTFFERPFEINVDDYSDYVDYVYDMIFTELHDNGTVTFHDVDKDEVITKREIGIFYIDDEGNIIEDGYFINNDPSNIYSKEELIEDLQDVLNELLDE